jgi:crotonobetainyl-CoA:carnitine CoA-transferase CaiB-like acyl-CoA transferase
MGDDAERYQSQVNDVEKLVQDFLEKKTRQELYQGALDRRILLAPVATVSDIAHDRQLASRGYFQTVPDAIEGRAVVLPGPFVKFAATPIAPPRRAPRLGEHNLEVYGDLLGYDRATLSRLYTTGAI